MTQKDAMMFPLIASCALFGLYMIFNIFGKEYINMLLSFYFLVLGIFALSHMVSPVVLKLVPSAVPVIPFHLQFTQGEGDARESVVDYQFNTHDLVSFRNPHIYLLLCDIVSNPKRLYNIVWVKNSAVG